MPLTVDNLNSLTSRLNELGPDAGAAALAGFSRRLRNTETHKTPARGAPDDRNPAAERFCLDWRCDVETPEGLTDLADDCAPLHDNLEATSALLEGLALPALAFTTRSAELDLDFPVTPAEALTNGSNVTTPAVAPYTVHAVARIGRDHVCASLGERTVLVWHTGVVRDGSQRMDEAIAFLQDAWRHSFEQAFKRRALSRSIEFPVTCSGR